MKIYRNPAIDRWPQLCQRPSLDVASLETTIAGIFKRVQTEKDAALQAYTKQFDAVSVEDVSLTAQELTKLAKQTPKPLRQAINQAYANIALFHKAQISDRQSMVETQPGVRCWRETRPIERVGLYVPGGSAPLFSTVLMLGVPAQLAGCSEIVFCTPPQADGLINPAICYAAQLVGATRVLRIGGAQAIAAMACGTESVLKVDKIFGPGNQYVAAAKRYAERFGVASDLPAGPSELMVLTDTSARADFVAADLLSQAEHGPDSQVVLVSTSASFVKAVQIELVRQLETLPRKEIAGRALVNSFCAVFRQPEQMLAFANAYAPEHLIFNMANSEKLSRQIINAGSVFLGSYTPESAGDYASGTNHTLPTNGWARSCGGLSVEDFRKYISFQSLTTEGAHNLAPTVMAMAEAEGLEAHRRAMEVRL